ncbi:MAG: class I SAM-dependent methyltransferase [Gammaproteobacteria bacterium]|nr:class I SAM-dependent methyltransferase [Gammaproteobacteria bacterium]
MAALNSGDIKLANLGDGIEIVWADASQSISFVHSFSRAASYQRLGSTNQAILKACNNKQRSIKTVLDLTAGWGIDSFILARRGKQVTLLEQNEVVFSIVSQSLANALLQKHTEIAAQQIKALRINSLDFLNSLDNNSEYDCIYLDPMFPAHRSTAKPSKEMQLLQKLTNNLDIEACFELALTKASNRVVVKRPVKSAPFVDKPADLTYREKTIRFDVYLTAGRN